MVDLGCRQSLCVLPVLSSDRAIDFPASVTLIGRRQIHTFCINKIQLESEMKQ